MEICKWANNKDVCILEIQEGVTCQKRGQSSPGSLQDTSTRWHIEGHVCTASTLWIFYEGAVGIESPLQMVQEGFRPKAYGGLRGHPQKSSLVRSASDGVGERFSFRAGGRHPRNAFT